MPAVLGLVLGIVALTAGAELVLRSGVSLAERIGVSPIVIGITVVSVGTSAPELAVGIDAALADAPTLAVGNIAGTNVVNLVLILGLSALVRPLTLHTHVLRLDLPAMVAAATLLLVLVLDGHLGRGDGLVLLAAALAYTLVILRWARFEATATAVEFEAELEEEELARPAHPGRNLAVLVAGIAVVVVGAQVLVDAAVELARSIGWSEATIGLTVVAIGTSAPELFTTVVATVRGGRDVAVGNLFGSATYNIAAILGVTALVAPNGIPVPDELVRIDVPIMLLATLVCVPVFWTGRRVSRLEGGAFVAAYAVYLTYLLVQA